MRIEFIGLVSLVAMTACGEAAPGAEGRGGAGGSAAGRSGASSSSGGAGASAGNGTSAGAPSGGNAGSGVAGGGATAGQNAAGAGAGGGLGGRGGEAGQGASGSPSGGRADAGAAGDGIAGGRAGAAGDGGAGGRAGAGEAGATNAGATSGGAAGGPTLPPVTDYRAAGPFATTVDSKVGPGNAYTVYRPSMLGQNGFLHAPIIFGPGIGQEVTVHATMLTNFASHGFVVVGTPVLNGGPGDANNRKSMQDGLDWILAQNEVAGTYQHKLWVDHAVSMGYSVGGTSAVEIGGNAAVATTVSIHGHKASAALHGPLLQTTGTLDTVGMPLQQQTYDMSMVQTFLATLTGADHGYIQNAGGGDERPAILAWMRHFIYSDSGAEHYFYGTDCTLCQSPWENPQRKNWP